MTLWRWYLCAFLSVSIVYRVARLVITVRKATRSGRGKRTAKPIFWVMTSGYLVLLGTGAWEAFRLERPASWALAGMGLFLYIGALGLRELAMRDLGRYFSPDIEIREGHRVVRQGFYAWVRHPLLVCLIVEVAGLGLALNAFHSLLLVGAGFYLPIILARQHLEEKTLQSQLGEEYRRYQEQVGAFVPKWSTILQNGKRAAHV